MDPKQYDKFDIYVTTWLRSCHRDTALRLSVVSTIWHIWHDWQQQLHKRLHLDTNVNPSITDCLTAPESKSGACVVSVSWIATVCVCVRLHEATSSKRRLQKANLKSFGFNRVAPTVCELNHRSVSIPVIRLGYHSWMRQIDFVPLLDNACYLDNTCYL